MLAPMRGLEIQTTKEGVTLDDILQLCKKEARKSTWRCRHLDLEGASTQALEHAAEEELDISGADFLELVSDIDHVVEGDFEARRSGTNKPWLVVRAIDGEAFEIYSSDQDMLAHVEATFRDVRPTGFSD
jgi:hypothetical protein